MSHRSVVAFSAGITAFVLAIVAAVTIYMGQYDTAASAAGGAPPLETQAAQATGLDLQAQSLTDGREAMYRQQLDQAKRQLKQANAQLQEAYDKLQALTAASSTPAPASIAPAEPAIQEAAPVVYAVSPEQAAAIAFGIAPGTTLTRQPDLVSFQGAAAYEVQLDSGVVYIDANSGGILYDGTVSMATSAQPATFSGDDNGEHEGHDAEDHSGGDD
ncbi:MAG: hypothetical protein ABI670_06805 [Chloroflexota bacterium]